MKYLLLTLLLALAIFSFGQKSNDGPPPSKPPVIPHVGDTVVGHPGVYKLVESMPEYPGGDDAMMKFIQRNIKYPDMERESDIQGRVVIGMVVNQDGSLSDIVVKKGVSSGIDKEALRVVRLMPQFKPGKQSGKAVRVRYLIPIMFKLASPEPPKKQ